MRFRFAGCCMGAMEIFPPRPQSGSAGGFTFIDVLGAVVLIAIGLTSLIAANSRSMIMLKSAKQAAVASKCLQQRIEQIRTYNWTQVTDAQAMQSLYSVPPLPSVELPGFAEQVTVSAFVPPTTSGTAAPAPTGPVIQITRDVNGVTNIASDNPNLTSGQEVRVDVQVSWPGSGGVTHVRETSVVVANGGVGR